MMKDTQIKKVHRLLDLLFSMGTLALGLFFIFVIPSWNWLGISLLITAAFMLPFYKTGYVIKNQEGVFLKKEILLPRECKRQIAEYMEGRSDNLDISPFNMGGQAGLSVFVAVCASLAMCLPISTPPNAIAASTGLVETTDMAKVGLIVGIVGLILGFFWVTKFFPFPMG